MIRVLEDRVINKIAAGEVVERPASVVKELVENALDAGATDLRIELKSGGRSLIRVMDNGKGMDEHDASLCIERHATSKIRDDKDLFAVGTLGFRGEALPSIAAVSRFTLTTRTHDAPAGHRVVVEGGRLVRVEQAGAPLGTEVLVRNLFFNVPARRKFLRTAKTELGHCLEAVVREVVIRPGLDVEVTHDDHPVIRAPVTADLRSRAADLLGEHGQVLVPISFRDQGLEVDALLSPVGVHKATSTGASYLYVNGRFVRDATLRRAVNEAYRGLVPKGRYPTVVLCLTLPPQQVDVNVHPAKTEVRFQNMRDVVATVSHGLRQGLERHGIKRPVANEARYRAPAPAPQMQVAEPRPALFGSSEGAEPSAPPPPYPPSGFTTPPPVIPSSPATPEPALSNAQRDLLPVPRYRDLTVLGQYHNTYLLCEGGGDLVIIDQHAAHERVMLHDISHHARHHLGGAQRKLAPEVVELNRPQAAALAEHAPHLLEYGLELEPFGGTAFAIKQVPEALEGRDLRSLVVDLADDLLHGGAGRPADDLIEYVLATMACRSAVKAGQPLALEEMTALLDRMDTIDFSVCAHGRPVAITMTAGELERRFHRS